MTKRYTPDQLLGMAGYYENNGDDKTTGAMLRQAASDAARIAALEADAERLDWLVRHRTMSIHGSDERGSWSVMDGSSGLTFVSRNEPTYRSAIDAARSST